MSIVIGIITIVGIIFLVAYFISGISDIKKGKPISGIIEVIFSILLSILFITQVVKPGAIDNTTEQYDKLQDRYNNLEIAFKLDPNTKQIRQKDIERYNKDIRRFKDDATSLTWEFVDIDVNALQEIN